MLLSLDVIVKPPKIGCFGVGSTFLQKDGKFWMSVVKYGSPSNMWQSLVEVRSVTTEDGVRKKRTRAKYNDLPCICIGCNKKLQMTQLLIQYELQVND